MSKAKTVDLTSGPILKTLAELALPIMISSMLGTAYSIMDMAWIGLLGAKAVAGHVTEKAAERAGNTVPGNDPDDVYGIKRRLFGGQCHPGLQKRSGADVWKRGHDRPGDRVYGPADGDEPSG